ncbi:MAG: hypothetical protein KF770_17690 [Anaerolineae bacterium]|nr:hypothetical protein [Anaerolineae bacterium]
MDRKQGLFTPSLQGWSRPYPDPKKRPWRVSPQYLVALFTGPLVVTLIAWFNGKRLLLRPTQLRFILITGGISTAIAWGIPIALSARNDLDLFWQVPMNRWWVSNLVTAVICCFIFALVQNTGMRVYVFFHGDKGFSRFWIRGVAVIIFMLFVQGILVSAILNRIG